ncbi:UNVERIFIED_CONTAM: hypothetical protein Slati_2492800 [Sesamum latifolium]|uniref:Uncharacterized protein n=1 Tax=Sesamum latifolium TaxID=2727402 RepID=A0AAW2WEF4_9LAMI
MILPVSVPQCAPPYSIQAGPICRLLKHTAVVLIDLAGAFRHCRPLGIPAADLLVRQIHKLEGPVPCAQSCADVEPRSNQKSVPSSG